MDVHPKVGHAMRIDYAMWRAFHAAMDLAMAKSDAETDFDLVPREMRRLLREWGIEVVELPSWPNLPGPPAEPSWPEDEP